MKDTEAYLEWIVENIKSGLIGSKMDKEYWNSGGIIGPDGYGKIHGICGDTMEISLKISDGIITEASFLTDGCMSSQLCGSAAAFLARGERLTAALNISAGDIINLFSRFDGIDTHCAILAVSTLYRAIAEYMLKQQQYLIEQEIVASTAF